MTIERWGAWEPAINQKFSSARILEFSVTEQREPVRLYVFRVRKGARFFGGCIDGERVGSWDTIEMACAQTARIARERFQ